MSTDTMKLDLFDGGSFKRWQKKPWLNPMNVSSSEMTISFDVATSSMLCRIQSWTYIKIILVLGNFGKLSRNASSRKTQQTYYDRELWHCVMLQCKEAEWLRDLLINIPLQSQPMPPISVHCDSQSTLSRAYNQVYNGMSRHIRLRHRQVNQLINDGVITVSFLRSSKILADPFTKGLPRKLIESTLQGMGLKPMYK
ncbi:hypothetical protein Tco_1161301 [Tanacetum coccineum]